MLIYNRIFNKQKLFIINVHIEEEGGFFKEKVYFEFYNDYSRNKSIKMLLNAMDLRSIAYAIKEALKKGQSGFRKITGGKSQDKKSLSISGEYINAGYKDLKIGVQFSKYEMAGLSDLFNLLADEIDKKIISLHKEK
jgi:hypothetical protein